MKKMFNVFAILLAVCLAAAFVSCKNDDDDDDPSVVAVYKYSDDVFTETYTFYDDNTVTNVYVDEEGTQTISGTWTGSLSGTGTISIYGETETFSVSGNTMTIGNGNEYTKQ